MRSPGASTGILAGTARRARRRCGRSRRPAARSRQRRRTPAAVVGQRWGRRRTPRARRRDEVRRDAVRGTERGCGQGPERVGGVSQGDDRDDDVPVRRLDREAGCQQVLLDRVPVGVAAVPESARVSLSWWVDVGGPSSTTRPSTAPRRRRASAVAATARADEQHYDSPSRPRRARAGRGPRRCRRGWRRPGGLVRSRTPRHPRRGGRRRCGRCVPRTPAREPPGSTPAKPGLVGAGDPASASSWRGCRGRSGWKPKWAAGWARPSTTKRHPVLVGGNRPVRRRHRRSRRTTGRRRTPPSPPGGRRARVVGLGATPSGRPLAGSTSGRTHTGVRPASTRPISMGSGARWRPFDDSSRADVGEVLAGHGEGDDLVARGWRRR